MVNMSDGDKVGNWNRITDDKAALVNVYVHTLQSPDLSKFMQRTGKTVAGYHGQCPEECRRSLMKS